MPPHTRKQRTIRRLRSGRGQQMTTAQCGPRSTHAPRPYPRACSMACSRAAPGKRKRPNAGGSSTKASAFLFGEGSGPLRRGVGKQWTPEYTVWWVSFNESKPYCSTTDSMNESRARNSLTRLSSPGRPPASPNPRPPTHRGRGRAAHRERR